jgi:hypothetical protein
MYNEQKVIPKNNDDTIPLPFPALPDLQATDKKAKHMGKIPRTIQKADRDSCM